MIEGGINLGGNWAYDSKPFTEGFGVSFGRSDLFVQDYSTKIEKYWSFDQRMNFAVAPRIGYFLFRNLAVGTDIKYRMNTIKYASDDFPKYTTCQYGIFMREYLGNKRIIPFIEAGTGFGFSTSKSGLESSSGGGTYTFTEKKNLFYLSGSVGASYSIIKSLKVNLFAKVQHTRERFSDKSDFTTNQIRTLNFDSALVLSFSYFFNLKNKD